MKVGINLARLGINTNYNYNYDLIDFTNFNLSNVILKINLCNYLLISI